MAERVRVGVVGTSWFADLLHLPCLKSHRGAEIAAICGRRKDRAEEMAAKYEIPSVYSDYREMIDLGQLDAAVIIVPDDLHYQITMDALDAGLHVLCEKPLANGLSQARDMYEKAQDAGVKHMTFFTYRWFSNYRHLKALIDAGSIGETYGCNVRYLTGGARRTRYAWRHDRQRSHGVLGDLGSHMIDMVRWLVGDFVRVRASLSCHVPKVGPDGGPLDRACDTALLTFELAGGARGAIHLTRVAQLGERVQRQELDLFGKAGTLTSKMDWQGAAIEGVEDGADKWQDQPVPEALLGGADPEATFMEQFHHIFRTQPIGDRLFIESILEDRPIEPSFYDGLKAQEVIDAALVSDSEGRWVNVSEM